MGNNEMRSIVRRRLLIKDPDIHRLSKCKCGHALDPYGWHLQICQKFSKWTIRTHEEIKTCVGRILNTARIQFACEICPFKDKETANFKRLDLVVTNARNIDKTSTKEKGLIDVTVVNSMRNTKAWINQSDATDHHAAATNLSQAAKKAEIDKFSKYAADAAAHNMAIFPMAFEAQGTWGPNTHIIFKNLMDRIQDKNNVDRASLTTKAYYWMQQLSFTVYKYVARHIEDAASSLDINLIHAYQPPNYTSFATS
jgi:hypothetical protein